MPPARAPKKKRRALRKGERIFVSCGATPLPARYAGRSHLHAGYAEVYSDENGPGYPYTFPRRRLFRCIEDARNHG